jgi:spore germination cell wall hydrolase CwlJ-like protein
MIITTAAATCLAMNIYFEARGEGVDAQRMVAEVVMERVSQEGYPKTVCGVVWDEGQFSWTSDGLSDKPKDTRAWLQSQIIANDVLLYGGEFLTGATHYHSTDVHPYWADDMMVMGQYGKHIFYRNNACDE